MHNIYDAPHLIISVGEYNIIMQEWLDNLGFDRPLTKTESSINFNFSFVGD